jgi:hypothetical protein
MSQPNYKPSEAQIRAECQEIQRDWTRAERRRRAAGIVHDPVIVREVSIHVPGARESC